jgi:hypothetical protein
LQILWEARDHKTSKYVFPNTSNGKSLSPAGMLIIVM